MAKEGRVAMIRSIRSFSRRIPSFDVDDMLGYMGLERHRSLAGTALPAIGLMAVGMLAGAGIALMFAPSSGKQLRAELQRRALEVRDVQLPRLMNQAMDAAKEVGVTPAANHAHARTNELG
jgi:hypothetical protein